VEIFHREGIITTINDNKSNNDRPKLKIILNFKQYEGLLDSGATVSCISESLFRIINKNNKLTLLACNQNFVSVSSTPLQILGKANIPINCLGKSEMFTFYILKGIIPDIILGIDFWRTFNLNIQYKKDNESPEINISGINTIVNAKELSRQQMIQLNKIKKII